MSDKNDLISVTRKFLLSEAMSTSRNILVSPQSMKIMLANIEGLLKETSDERKSGNVVRTHSIKTYLQFRLDNQINDLDEVQTMLLDAGTLTNVLQKQYLKLLGLYLSELEQQVSEVPNNNAIKKQVSNWQKVEAKAKKDLASL